MEECCNKKYSMLSDENFRKKVTIMSLVSAFMVMLIHSYWVYPEASMVYYIEMPVATKVAYFFNWIGMNYTVQFFFILSGFLLFRNMTEESLWRKMKRRAFSLVVPYILWNAFYIVFWIIAACCGWSDVSVDLTPLAIIKSIITHQYMEHYWFMGNLIIYVAVSPLIFLLSRNKVLFIVFDVTMVILHLLLNIGFITFLISDQDVFGADWFLYFLVGVNVAMFFPNLFIIKLDMRGHRNFLIWGGIILCLALTKLFGALWITRIIMRVFTILYIVIIVCSTVAWDRMQVKRWMNKSFVIYSWHGMVCSFISKVIYRILPDSYVVEIIDYISYLFIGLTVIIILDEITRRLIPQTRRLFLGGRDA